MTKSRVRSLVEKYLVEALSDKEAYDYLLKYKDAHSKDKSDAFHRGFMNLAEPSEVAHYDDNELQSHVDGRKLRTKFAAEHGGRKPDDL